MRGSALRDQKATSRKASLGWAPCCSWTEKSFRHRSPGQGDCGVHSSSREVLRGRTNPPFCNWKLVFHFFGKSWEHQSSPWSGNTLMDVDKGSPAPPSSSEKSQSPPVTQEEDEQARHATENDFLLARCQISRDQVPSRYLGAEAE